MRATRLLFLAALLGALPLGAGCLFAPRDAEAPSTVSVQYLPKTSSANAWANLEKSLINTHAFGWEDNILPDGGGDFIYIPDSGARDLYGDFSDWNREKEIAFINKLYDSGVTITATLKDADFVIPEDTGSEVLWDGVIYDLTVTSTVDQSSIRYRAKANITFRLEGSFYYIAKWEDEVGESNPDNPGQFLPTMGVLRGSLGSN